jgi:hypothetical protein
MPLAEDQDVIEALAAKRTHEPVRRMHSLAVTGLVS